MKILSSEHGENIRFGNSMNNLMSYCGLVDAKIRANLKTIYLYSWSVSMKSRGSRQKIIQNRFYFDCKCNFCQEEAGYYNNDLKVYKEFGNLVEKLQEFKPEYETSYYGQFLGNSNKLTTADLKKQLIILKEMYKLGKTKNLGEQFFDA